MSKRSWSDSTTQENILSLGYNYFAEPVKPKQEACPVGS